MNSRLRPALRWAYALAWGGVIWALSSRPVVPAIPVPYADKLLHAVEFGVLAVLIYRAAATPRLHPFARATAATLACFLYGIADEIHQAYVPGRSCEPADAMADLAGAAIAAFAAAWICGRRAPAPGPGRP